MQEARYPSIISASVLPRQNRWRGALGVEVRRIATTRPNSGSLFDGKLVYIVPNYQRLYVWSMDEQWEPLWSDVRDIAEELIQSAAGSELVDADADADGVDAHSWVPSCSR